MRNCAKAGQSPTTLPDARQVSELGDGGATSPVVTAVNDERVGDHAVQPQSLVEIAIATAIALAELKELKNAVSGIVLSQQAIGLPGRRVAGRREEEIPSLYVVKTFFEAFYIGREYTTPNTQQPGQAICCVTTRSVFFALFARVFRICTIGGGSSESGACTPQIFGCVWLHPHHLPTGTKVFRQFVSILDANDDVERQSQCKVLTGRTFISTEAERGACAGKLLAIHVFTREFAEIFADPDVSNRDETKAVCAKLKECILASTSNVLSVKSPCREPSEERAMSWPTQTHTVQCSTRMTHRSARNSNRRRPSRTHRFREQRHRYV